MNPRNLQRRALVLAVTIFVLALPVRAQVARDSDAARQSLRESTSKSEKLAALAIVAATSDAGRTEILLQVAAADPDSELRERSALALASSEEIGLLPRLYVLLDAERDASVRYALRQAIGSIERNAGVSEHGITIRLASSGLDGTTATGLVSFEAVAVAGPGFARMTVHLPRGLTKMAGETEWHGSVERGESRRMDVQVLADQPGIYDVRCTYWLKLRDGETYKGGNRTRTESIRVSAGDTSGFVAPRQGSVEQ